MGGMLARALSAYDLKVCVLEKENDVAMGATHANSGIVHAGYDAAEGSLKARLNVRGSRMMQAVAGELGVPYRRNGSLVIGFGEEDECVIRALYARGISNGVKELRILEGEEARTLEPALSDQVSCALYAPHRRHRLPIRAGHRRHRQRHGQRGGSAAEFRGSAYR